MLNTRIFKKSHHKSRHKSRHKLRLLPAEWWQLDRPGRYWLVVGVVVATMAAADFLNLARPYYYLGRNLLRPIGRSTVSAAQAVSWPWRAARRANSAARRVQQLETTVTQLESQLAELEGLRAENRQLRDRLQSGDDDARLAGVLGSDSQRRVTSPIVSLAQPGIGIGSNQGVQPGNMVLVSGVLVGVVSGVEPESAQVDVISRGDAQSIVAVTESGAEGVVVGDGRRVLLTEVLPDTPVEVGERVTSLGQPGIPRDVLIGSVAVDVSQAQDPVATLVIDQAVKFATARLVEVVVTGQPGPVE